MSELQEQSRILNQHGNPFPAERNAIAKASGSESPQVTSAFSSYFSSLYGLNQDATLRAMSPFENHAWVYAGAMAIAMNISQAVFNIYTETEAMLAQRRSAVLRCGQKWFGPPCGRERQAVRRHLTNPQRRQGVVMEGVEKTPTHPLLRVFAKPNDFMTEAQLWQATALWQVLRGSCMWVMMSESGLPLQEGEMPYQIIPLPPSYFRPIMMRNEIIAWRYRVPIGLGQGYSGATLYLQPNEVIQFKFFSEISFIGGFAPVAASVSAIAQDLLAVEHTKSTLSNGADPGGIIYSENGFEDDAEEKKFLNKWEQRHKGSFNKSRTAIISGGIKYVQTGLTPQDMQWIEMRKWNRDEILACMGVPKTCVGVTDDVVYATAMTQDNNFWNKRLFPMLRNVEDVIDATILFNEPDNTMAAFDVSGIESLRVGYADKINQLNILTAPNIHMPPKQAAETIGLIIPSYPGDTEALVTPMLRPAEDVIADSKAIGDMLNGPDESTPGSPGSSTKPDDKVPDNSGKPDTPPAGTGDQQQNKRMSVVRSLIARSKSTSIWTQYVAQLQHPVEVNFKNGWRKTVAKWKSANLILFDRSVHIDGNKTLRALQLIEKVSDSFDMNNVILPEGDLKDALQNSFDPLYRDTVQKAYDYAVEELGSISVFSVDGPAVQKLITAREDLVLGSVPATIQSLIRDSLIKGIQAGETIQQLRSRISAIYDNISQSRSLIVARTESNSFISDVRNEIFIEEGFQKKNWVTAGDEHVRTNHQIYGQAGPQDIKFNYLELTSGAGTLTHPGDTRAPADEVSSCRCVEVPEA